MSHTPGPWKRIRGGDGWFIQGPTRNLIGEFVNKGDVHVIEAAPDMLEALEAVANSMGFLNLDLETSVTVSRAIVKAKGGSNPA